jgi:phosphinothricin acetyltransferase
LLAELMAALERAGVRRVMAVIGDSANAGSIGVHRACGFEMAGAIPACGWKFDRWLDIVFMQRSLGEGDRSAPQATP